MFSEVSESNALKFNWEQIGDVSERRSSRFRRIERRATYRVEHNIGEFENLIDIANAVDTVFEEIMQPHLEAAAEKDIVSVTIAHQNLDSDIFLPPRRKHTFNREEFLDKIFAVAQSNKDYLFDGEMTVTVAIMKNLSGKGPRRDAPKKLAQISRDKRSVTTISNRDSNCFLRALAVSIFVAEGGKENTQRWDQIRKDRQKVQETFAKGLGAQVGITWNTPVTDEHFARIQQNLPGYQIIIVDARNPKHPIFTGPRESKKVYLEYIDEIDGDGHFNSITNIKAYLNARYFCEECYKEFSSKGKHMCQYRCSQCNGYPKCIEGNMINCNECHREFYGHECFDNHKHNDVCKYQKCCERCGRSFRFEIGHECDLFYCSKCGQGNKKQPHFCFISELKKEKIMGEDMKAKFFVSYDIESIQENNRHIPNLLISSTVCDECWCETSLVKNTENCNQCGIGWQTFFGADCITKFCDYLFDDLAKKAELIDAMVHVFAHNARGYDSHFLLQDIWKRSFERTGVVMQGRKILRLKAGNVSIIDSLSFFLQPLAALPKAFGLNVELRKGWFPHKFNKVENYSYVGPIPDIQYYGVEYMKPNAASELRKWHTQMKESNYVFNFMNELIQYCKNDVEILVKSIMVFKRNVKEITGLDPYTMCFTLASLGLEVYRCNFLVKNTIGITPVNGYTSSRCQSKSAQCWLDWRQHEFGVKIIREYKVGKFIADGFDTIYKRVFEFFGCRFHGCECYYPDNRDTKIPYFQKTPNELLTEVENKLSYFRSLGFEVHYIWECQYKEWKSTFDIYQSYFKERFIHYSRIEKYGCADIKESFFGGRTNNLRFFYECSENEEICYVDFISLYPDVLKNRVYPIGHPEVIRENFDYSLQSYFGFVKCIVSPPRRLYFPVLPYRINQKLMFPLCRICAENMSQSECIHDDKDRYLINTWTTEELKIALTKGYRIVTILEVLHYEKTSGSLFRGYINMWLKIKQESSGWPASCTTEESKRQFIHDYHQKGGIRLDYDKIEKNEALRFIAKIMLNSFWGKLAQKPNLPVSKIINSYDQYMKEFLNESIEIKGEVMVTNSTMLLTSAYRDESEARQGLTNIAIASYVTAYARLKLFHLIDRIENQRPFSVLYHDTDSVIFVRHLNDPLIETGNYLGELTNEFESYVGAKCYKFASLGPKNYGYELRFSDGSTKAFMKVKGLALTENTLDLVNFRQMVELAKEYKKGNTLSISCPQFQIRCDTHHIVRSKYFEKVYRATADKRRIEGDITLPYGY